MSFDLKKIALVESAIMPLRDAAGEKQFDEAGKPLSITLIGAASKQYQQTKYAAEQKGATRMMSKMQGKQDGKINWSDNRDERATQLANCTLSFNGFGIEGLSGHELFKAVYNDIALEHIFLDASKFVDDNVNFMQGSTKS